LKVLEHLEVLLLKVVHISYEHEHTDQKNRKDEEKFALNRKLPTNYLGF
jgi:hypothetical protein